MDGSRLLQHAVERARSRWSDELCRRAPRGSGSSSEKSPLFVFASSVHGTEYNWGVWVENTAVLYALTRLLACVPCVYGVVMNLRRGRPGYFPGQGRGQPQAPGQCGNWHSMWLLFIIITIRNQAESQARSEAAGGADTGTHHSAYGEVVLCGWLDGWMDGWSGFPDLGFPLVHQLVTTRPARSASHRWNGRMDGLVPVVRPVRPARLARASQGQPGQPVLCHSPVAQDPKVRG